MSWTYSGLPGTSALDETRLAYLAGIVDGEGTINARMNKSGSMDLSFSVANTDMTLILWIVEHFGGQAMPVNQSNPNPKHKPVWRVWWRRKDAVVLLERLMPYLLIKARRAALFIELNAMMTNKRRLTAEERTARVEPLAEMIALNKRGAA